MGWTQLLSNIRNDTRQDDMPGLFIERVQSRVSARTEANLRVGKPPGWQCVVVGPDETSSTEVPAWPVPSLLTTWAPDEKVAIASAIPSR